MMEFRIEHFLILLSFYNSVHSKESLDIKQAFKILNKNIDLLVHSEDIIYDDKEKLKENQHLIMKSKNVTDLREEIEKINQLMEGIKGRCEKRKKSRLFKECLDEIIKYKDYKKAVNKLYQINDNTVIDVLIKTIYDGKQDNFNSILNLIDAIPSISLSLKSLKSFKKLLEKNKHLNSEKGLILIQNLGQNVILQVATDSKTKIEANKFSEELKKPVAEWIVKKFSYATKQRMLDDELTRVCDMISYDIKDLKFLREIAERITHDEFVQDYPGRVLNVTEKMRPVTYVIINNHVYSNFLQRGINSFSIAEIITVFKAVRRAYSTITNKKLIEKFVSMPDPKIKVVNFIKKALLNDFYSSEHQIIQSIYKYDEQFFQNVVNASVYELYGKKDLIEILKSFRSSRMIAQSFYGYDALFNVMRENRDLEPISKNIGPLLKLNYFVKETLDMDNIVFVKTDILLKLNEIHNVLMNINEDVFQILNVTSGTVDQESSDIYRTIFKAEVFGFFSGRIADFYGVVDTNDLVDYVMDLPLLDQKVIALAAIQDKTSEYDDGLFSIAKAYKNIMKKRKEIQSDFKTTFESYRSSLPSSLVAAIFSESVYIKTLSRGGEYLCADNEVYTLRNGRKEENCVWKLEHIQGTLFHIKSGFNGLYLANKEEEVIPHESMTNWNLELVKGGVFIKYGGSFFYPEYKCKDENKRFIYVRSQGSENLFGIWVIQDAM